MSGVPRHMAGWPFLRGQPLLRRLLRPVFRRFSAGAPLLCSRSACRFSAAFTQTLLCLFVWPALPARRALCARSSVLFWLSVCLFRVGCTRVFLLSFIFCLFLFGFCRANFFSFVAQAATGISLLVPSRGFVPGLQAVCRFCAWPVLLPVAFVLCLRCRGLLAVCAAFLSCFFALSCLTFSSQTSFHLSLMPRRGFPCLSPPVALFPAFGSCHLLLFRGPLCPLPVFPFCVVRTGFLFCFSPFPA